MLTGNLNGKTIKFTETPRTPINRRPVAFVSENTTSASIRYQRQLFWESKINGKTIRKFLQTAVWSTAQIAAERLLKAHQENRNKVDAPLFNGAVRVLKTEWANDSKRKEIIVRGDARLTLLSVR
jgi:hypothetical protein